MNNLLRAFFTAGLIVVAIMMIAVGLARHSAELLHPLHLILFVAVVVLYLVPSALALYRNCNAAAWIAALNILLGWTLFGWVIALGWAASGKARTRPPSIPARPIRSAPGH
jgi:hypothetical protein